jgi:hypothetical protein
MFCDCDERDWTCNQAVWRQHTRVDAIELELCVDILLLDLRVGRHVDRVRRHDDGGGV